MGKKQTIGEALRGLFAVNKVSKELFDFKPSSMVAGEPLYTLMEHDEGILNGKYYTIDAPGSVGALVFFENLEKAEFFYASRDTSTNVKTKYYVRGVSKAHLETLVNFMELGGAEAALIDDEYISKLRRGEIIPIRIRYLSPAGLRKLAQNGDSGLFNVLKRFLLLSGR